MNTKGVRKKVALFLTFRNESVTAVVNQNIEEWQNTIFLTSKAKAVGGLEVG